MTRFLLFSALVLVLLLSLVTSVVEAKPAMRRLVKQDGRQAITDPRHYDPEGFKNPYYDNRKRRRSLTKGMTVQDVQ